jgi:hypothetical protein
MPARMPCMRSPAAGAHLSQSGGWGSLKLTNRPSCYHTRVRSSHVIHGCSTTHCTSQPTHNRPCSNTQCKAWVASRVQTTLCVCQIHSRVRGCGQSCFLIACSSDSLVGCHAHSTAKQGVGVDSSCTCCNRQPYYIRTQVYTVQGFAQGGQHLLLTAAAPRCVATVHWPQLAAAISSSSEQRRCKEQGLRPPC